MKKNDTLRRAAALMAALSITVSLAAPAFAGTYYIDYGDITIEKNADGTQTIKQNGAQVGKDAAGEETIITTHKEAAATLESDLENPAAEDSDFGPVVEDNYQQESTDQPAAPAQPEDADQPEGADQQKDADQQESADQPAAPAQPENAEEPKDADQPESAEEPKAADRQVSADQQESAGQQAQPQQVAPAAAPAASTPKNDKGNGFWGNTITVINNFADKVLNLTLKDVKIDVSDTGKDTGNPWNSDEGKAALSVQGKGNVEIELDGKNELKSGAHRAGLEKNTSTSTGTLTLKDDKKDDKEAGIGSLKATGGQYAAGIGNGGYYGNGGNRSGENITITGGTVTATGGWGGAGIGGGYYGSGKNITIKGGTVTATGGDEGAGIGGGYYYGNGENIKITDGTVNATGGWGGAGIGGGGGYDGCSGKNITITGGTVTAGGGDRGAGIGGGINGSGEDITINGGTVTADGGVNAAGIGGGERGNGEDITITDGTVNAAGGGSGAGIGGGWKGSGSNVTVSGAAQVTAIAGKPDWGGAGATIGSGGSQTPDGPVDGKEIQANISGLTTGYIHHIIYEQDGTTIKKEWWEPERPQPKPENPQPNPEDPNAPAEESNEVDLGTPVLHVETLEGDPLPFDARQQGSTLRVTSDNLAARLHGTRQALEALQEQGVEQIQFVTSLKTTTLSVEDLLAEGGSWFALEHNGLGSRRLSAAQAESLKCWMH